MVSVERVLWGVIPACLGVAMIAATTVACFKKPTAVQIGLTFAVLALCVPALWILFRMFLVMTWPTGIPHVLLAVAAVLSVFQLRGH